MQPIVNTAEVAPPRQLPTRRSSGNPFLLRDNGLELRLASSRSERIEAQRLRFEVFNLELQLGLTSSLATVQEMIARRFLSDPSLRVTPRRGFDVPPLPRSAPVDETYTFRSLPPLFRGYLRLGAKVCGPPAYDRQFGTTDYFVLAKTRDIVARYSRRFFG